MERSELFVVGKVQGVFFRASAREIAERFGLKGFAENMGDDRVHIVAEGEREQLEKFAAWCKTGPSFASVKEIRVQWQPARGSFKAFTIR